MLKRFLIVTSLFFTVLPIQSTAVDSYGQVIRQRPENIDTSATSHSTKGAIIASYQLQETTVPLNKIHAWQLTLTDINGKALDKMNITFSSMMPEHLHGMTTKPRISMTDTAGEYVLEGMNFHMPGWWEITLQLSGYGMEEYVHFNLLVGEVSFRQ